MRSFAHQEAEEKDDGNVLPDGSIGFQFQDRLRSRPCCGMSRSSRIRSGSAQGHAFQGSGAIGGGNDLMPQLAKHGADKLDVRRLVVHDQNAGRRQIPADSARRDSAIAL